MSIYIFPDNHFILGNSKYLGIELKRRGIRFNYISFQAEERHLLKEAGLPYITLKDFNEKCEELIKPGDKCFFSTSPNMRLADEAYKRILHGPMHVQMWHGFPLKKIANASSPVDQREAARERAMRNRTTKLFINTASELDCERMKESFFCEDYRINGFPRCDIFYRSMTDQDFVNVPLAAYDRVREYRARGARVVMIMFTWTGEVKLYDEEYEQIYRLARSNPNVAFILKPHGNDGEVAADVPENVIVLGKRADPYPFVKLSHAVVTDISSIAVDALHPKKQGKTEIFFYHKKLADYVEWWGKGVYDDNYEEIGRVIYDLEDLVKIDLTPQNDCIKFEKYFAHYDGKSAERVMKSYGILKGKALAEAEEEANQPLQPATAVPQVQEEKQQERAVKRPLSAIFNLLRSRITAAS